MAGVGVVQELRMTLLAGAVVAAVAVAGCGGGEDRPATPQGFKRTETKYFAFAAPSGWRTEVRKPQQAQSPEELVAEAVGPAGTTGKQPDVVVGVTPRSGSSVEGLAQIQELDGKTRFPGWKVTARKDADVAGADEGRLIEAQAPAEDGTLVRTYNLLAMSKDRTAVSMFVAVPAADVDRARVHEILDSLEIRR
jgi:hypothetical protein